MFKLFDPNETIKHVPYRVLKAQYKRRKERTDRFFGLLIKASVIGALVLAFWLYVSQHM